MAVNDYNLDPDLNTTISGINIAEGCPPSGINNAIRQLMADAKQEHDAVQTVLTEEVGNIREDTLEAARQAVESGGGAEVGTVTLEGVAAEVASLGASKVDVDASNFSAAGKSLLADIGKPSDRYVDLTVGASETDYIMPASGWLIPRGLSTAEGQYIAAYGPGSETNAYETIVQQTGGTMVVLRCPIPVKKGDKIRVQYTIPSLGRVRFIYAEGEEA